MSRIFYIIIFFLISSFGINAQIEQDSNTKDSTKFNKLSPPDSSEIIALDTIQKALLDSLRTDSLDNIVFNTYNISDNPIEGDIDWGAKDLEFFDKDSNILKLYNQAYINYGTIELKANYIEYDLNKNEVKGIALIDSLGKITQKAVFKNGANKFNARLIRYNIKSKKGWVEYARRLEGDLVVHGEVGKFISKEADTINHVDQMFIKNGIITNCNNPDHPHWGIKASKIKMIPNKLAVFGKSVLELADVPTPIILPFGFYPMFQGQRSGLILPKKLHYDKALGVGIKDIGVYFALSDYLDLRLTGDIYTRGTHGLRIKTNYSKRYKYKGNFSFSYLNTITQSPNDTTKTKSPSFRVGLVHNQSSKAHPYQKLDGSIDLSFNGYQRAANTDYHSQTNNSIYSNFKYTNSLPGTPFNVAVSLRHSQNNISRIFDLTLPQIDLNMKTIYPFKSKKRIGKEKWYEKISFDYRGEAKNQINTTDTTLFTKETLNNMKYGAKNHLGTRATFRIFKYINATFGVTYDENHFFKIINKHLDSEIKIDTVRDSDNNIISFDTIYGNIITDTISKWKVYRKINPSFSLNTNKSKKLLFNKGWLRGIKHKIKYSISISGNPIDEISLYNRTVQTDLRPEYSEEKEYSIFEYQGAYGSARPRKQNLILNYSFTHILEAKYFSKKDSSLKKLSLLKNLVISGNYDITADSLKFSPIRVGFSFNMFKKFVNVRYSGILDPYMKIDNKRLNKYVFNERKWFPLRHEKSTLDISVYNKSLAQILNLFIKKDKSDSKTKSKSSKIDKDKLFNILKNFSLNYNLKMTWNHNRNNIDTFYISTHSIRLHGSLPITKNWSINVGNFSYNLKDKRFEYPDFGFSRDLHCWKMSFSWRPQGGSYSFFIGVKSSILNFVKYQHGVDPIRASLNKRGY